MNPIWLPIIWWIILTVWDIVMKKWVISDKTSIFILWMIIYTIWWLFVAYSFKFKNIAVASMIYIMVNIITLVLISWLYFKETLTIQQIIGITLGLISVIILEM